MDILDTTGKRIRAARNNLGLDQAALARAVEVHPKTVSRWENDVMVPDSDVLQRVAEALQVDIGWILSGKGPLAYGGPSIESGGAAVAEASAPPRLLRNHAIRVWLQQFRLRLTKARVPDEAIEEAMALLTAPSVFTFYSGGTAEDLGEEDVLLGMEGMTAPILKKLERMGYKVK